MGLLRSLPMLLLLMMIYCSLWLPRVRAQSRAGPLDTLLQDYAYRAFLRPRTGVPFDGVVPPNLTGIQISAMRLRSGSLRTRGVPNFKEFKLPTGVLERPYVERLVLVYQNMGNWSTVYYPLPGHTYLAPVLGLLAYDASNLSAKNLPELNIMASGQPISIEFPNVKPVPRGSVAKCVWFDMHGLINYTRMVSSNKCFTLEQGHFSIVVESTASPPPPPPNMRPNTSGKGKKNNSKVWIIVGSVVGGFVPLILLGVLILWALKYKRRKRMQQMEKAADVGEALHMARVGSTKAPAAMVTRTQPTLETEYMP